MHHTYKRRDWTRNGTLHRQQHFLDGQEVVEIPPAIQDQLNRWELPTTRIGICFDHTVKPSDFECYDTPSIVVVDIHEKHS